MHQWARRVVCGPEWGLCHEAQCAPSRPLLRGWGGGVAGEPLPWAGASPAGRSTQSDWAPPVGPLGRTQPHA